MKIAGRFIDLLGKQMYGGPVPAVAELIANSWDADSSEVSITIPNDVTKPDAQIVVQDKGYGMTFEELNNYYLEIGLARRERGERTPLGRLIMGRKGIGKLAGFGIAEEMQIISNKNGHKIGFTLSHSRLLNMKDLKEFDFPPEIDEDTKETDGVKVIFKKLKLKNQINDSLFRKSMGRRYALQSGQMSVSVNGISLTEENFDFEFRTPSAPGTWAEYEIPNIGKLTYWFGFLKKPINDKELKGISVFARDRVAQVTPFVFNLSGGINGQVGLEYLTGQVKADFLDDIEDCVATDRQGINWQFDIASKLEEWGQGKIKELCRDWKRRTSEKVEKFRHNYSDLFEKIQTLPDQERKDLESALERVAELEKLDQEDFRIIATSMVTGVERESIKKIIRKINTTKSNAMEEFISVVNEWDVISAVEIAEVTKGKIEVIQKLEEYIEKRIHEKSPAGQPDMQSFIKNHIWLLGDEFEYLKKTEIYHEKSVFKWIGDCLLKSNKEMPIPGGDSAKRFDLVCMNNPREIIVIELMRPGCSADYDHITRLNLYVQRIREAVDSQSYGGSTPKPLVRGILLADDIIKDGAVKSILKGFHGEIMAYDWKGLLNNVKGRYKDYYELLRSKAPNDPRLKELDNID